MKYRVRDIWHKDINGTKAPWVYSTDPKFENNIMNFFNWVGQHTGGNLSSIELVDVPKPYVFNLNRNDNITDCMTRADLYCSPDSYCSTMNKNKDIRRIALLAYEYRKQAVIIETLLNSYKEIKKVVDAETEKEMSEILNQIALFY